MKFFILILLIACEPYKRVTGKDKLTEVQKQYLAKSSLEIQAFMDSCLDSEYYTLDMCLEKYKKMGVVQPSSGASVLKTAAGVAIGYGAAKMILGK